MYATVSQNQPLKSFFNSQFYKRKSAHVRNQPLCTLQCGFAAGFASLHSSLPGSVAALENESEEILDEASVCRVVDCSQHI